MNEPDISTWRKCTSCKKLIAFRQKYWVCNVSTCNRKRTGLVFCSLECWDMHLPVMNHRESWAEERKAPTPEEWKSEQEAPARKPRASSTEKVPADAPGAKTSDPAAARGKPRTILRRSGG